MKFRETFKGIFEYKSWTFLFLNFCEDFCRVDPHAIANHYEAFPVLRHTKILSLKYSCIKLIFFAKVLSKVLLDFLNFISHASNILHNEEFWTHNAEELQISLV